jgi:hypothetical protein
VTLGAFGRVVIIALAVIGDLALLSGCAAVPLIVCLPNSAACN